MSSSAPAPWDHRRLVGIGASAGGLEAMLTLLARLPLTGRISYVVAQHMAHDAHSELMARLIGRESALPVVLAGDGDVLLPDTVHVIPAGRDGVVSGDKISLCQPGPGNLSTPSVNGLFGSIAEAAAAHGVGIVLSGTGSDGALGCRALKAAGGTVYVQDPKEARFDGMPEAAINTGCVDDVLPAATVADRLAAIFPDSRRLPSPAAEPALAADAEGVSAAERDELARLLPLVLAETGIDFSCYKEDTLVRRLAKRKSLLGLEDADAYLARAKSDPEELRTLQRLFLVSVSSFFRDRAAFAEVQRALAERIRNKPSGEPLRVWVPGCASGEECFTLAIVVAELLQRNDERRPVVIVGTDLNAEALALARSGDYSPLALREMDTALVDRYFVPRERHMELRADIRAMVRFEQRNVLEGPPADLAADVDLVSCRNLLIYMKSGLQDELVAAFHRMLRPDGLLFIGPSETLAVAGSQLFSPVDHHHRLYRRRP